MGMGVDPRLAGLLGDRRFRCFLRLLRGHQCKLVDVSPERLLEGNPDEIEKLYRLLPELDVVRRSGYDIIGRLVELGRKLRSENVRDLAEAVTLMFAVMFGASITEEDARKIGGVVDAFKCIRVEEDGIEVDGACLDAAGIPEELKEQIRAVSLANLVWS
jgi:hypothetical protein